MISTDRTVHCISADIIITHYIYYQDHANYIRYTDLHLFVATKGRGGSTELKFIVYLVSKHARHLGVTSQKCGWLVGWLFWA